MVDTTPQGERTSLLVLHGAWLPGQGSNEARFALWAEAADLLRPPPRRPRTGNAPRQLRRHPFAATGQLMLAALGGELTAGEGAEKKTVCARLPTRGKSPLPSSALASAEAAPAAAETVLATWTVEVLACAPVCALRLLAALGAGDLPPELALGDDLRYWTGAARLAFCLLYRQRFLPEIVQDGPRYAARWRPLLDPNIGPEEGSDRQRLRALARAMPPVCRALSWQLEAAEAQPGDLLRDFLAAAVDGVARESLPFGVLPGSSQRSHGETWLGLLQEAPVLPRAYNYRVAKLHEEYRAWSAPAAQSAAGESFHLCFRLSAPEPEVVPVAGPLAAQLPWTLEYLLQATDDPSLLVPAGQVWLRGGATARFLDRRLDNPQEHLLAGLGRAARLFAPIESSLRSPRPEAANLTIGQVRDFLRESALTLRSAGFGVLVPNLETKLGVRVKLRGRSSAQGLGLLGWSSVVGYDWQVMLGDQALTQAEFEALARLKQPLVQVRGRWIELRPEQVERALALLAQHGQGGELTLPEAIGLAMAPDGEVGLPVVDVAAEGWLEELLTRLGEGGQREELLEPPGFVGQLRPYQRVGLSWLESLRAFGLGACLADDMGLGKTVQVIALLLHARVAEPTPAPALLICPTSVVGNWQRELRRFAPSLRVLVHHGAEREREDFARVAAEHDVVISTYTLLHRDEAALADVAWSAAVLDEAQNVKNPSTRAAQAARRLRCAWRAALTGTPVENRLGDLWSIFQFLNPGYLGSGEQFKKRLAEPIERLHDAGATARLRKLVAPFILRRVKTDRAIIADLPEKNEMKVYCNLTQEQATLYEAVVQDALRQIEEAEGIARRGVVLAVMAKLKQVCDHPALFLKDQSELSGRSGKLTRLSEMLEEVLAVDERALIFTQYAEMGKLLVSHLEERFGRETLFLHGGTPAPERDRMVTRFQGERLGPPLFVLSLKAGGTGLNLTRANHVFHFDRWWNPAVENQATDRVFRIGQERNVEVHKFVCVGTFEEAIDDLIERKKEVAQAVVGTSEAWLTELSTQELRELFTLRADAVGAD